MKKLLLVLYCYGVSLAYGQEPLTKYMDSPLLNNARTMQSRSDFIITGSSSYDYYPFRNDVNLYDRHGTVLGKLKAYNEYSQNLSLRYTVFKGFEAQVGFTHNATQRILENTSGDKETQPALQWPRWSVGGRYSFYKPEQKLAVGLQASYTGSIACYSYYYTATGVDINLLISKQIGSKHEVTAGLGLKTLYLDELPVSLNYTYAASSQLGFYSKAAYRSFFTSIAVATDFALDFGGGVYYCFSDQWRLDIAGLYGINQGMYNSLEEVLQVNLGIAAGF